MGIGPEDQPCCPDRSLAVEFERPETHPGERVPSGYLFLLPTLRRANQSEAGLSTLALWPLVPLALSKGDTGYVALVFHTY